MGANLYPFFELCGLCCVAFWCAGFSTRLVAARKVRHQFRAKGFMEQPSGLGWFHFLRRKHYKMFDDSIARFLFAISRFCMMGLIVVSSGAMLFIGCILLLEMVSQIS
jgi:hypothetical protein